MAQTSKESVEKKFKDVFERSPGAFPEGTSLEEKVNYIAKGTKALKAVKSKELENKMENIAKLNKELEKRQRQNDEEIDKLRRSTQELRKEFGTSKRKKSNNKKLEQGEKDSAPQPQENQKEEGLFSLLKRFVKKILEKLLGEDEKSVENTHDMREAAQRNTLNNEVQQKSMDQSSFININGEEFNLEPEKAFNYQDKALKVSITYNSPETKQNLQQDTTSLNIANAINLNINGKEYNVQPGKSFNYKNPGLEISVINGHQQSKNFDRILNQDQSVSEGLKQATKLENPTITPVNTPKVNTGRER
ncbi:hypothetical protein [Wolbachia endosymbiont of Aedes albopictus]|nr:hypothetical protein [Wolbachia endosymbiont of Aedes albopictus]UVW84352.1 hypothetical protein NHG98_02510 [Wolbachia endosymbiont of Aedes albopictus]